MGRSGTHAARTMMFAELSMLFERTAAGATRADYRREVAENNALGKPTQKSRVLTFGHLSELYGLDSTNPVFRVFRRFWDADAAARPMLALMVALARDPLLRLSESFILRTPVGTVVRREDIEALLAVKAPDRFSAASLKSFAQNINGTWTQAGFLSGRARKTRVAPMNTSAVVAFALFLGHLEGLSGERLFTSSWVRLLPDSPDELVELANSASHRGFIVFLNAGGVKEVRFPGQLTAEEEKWLHE